MSETRAGWRDQLVGLALLTAGWFDRDSRKGGWGVAPDEGALTTARRFIECLGDAAERHPPRCDADPLDGAVHLQWWADGGGTLSVYIEAGVVSLILGAAGGAHTRFDPDRNDVPVAEAVAIVRAWLGGIE